MDFIEIQLKLIHFNAFFCCCCKIYFLIYFLKNFVQFINIFYSCINNVAFEVNWQSGGLYLQMIIKIKKIETVKYHMNIQTCILIPCNHRAQQ